MTKQSTQPWEHPAERNLIHMNEFNNSKYNVLNFMPWLWNSWEEYLHAVYPVAVNSAGGLWHAKKDTWFENVSRLCKAVNKLEDCMNSLRELGFTGKDHSRPPDDPKISQQASNWALEAVYAGEDLLFFDTRLS